MSDKFKDFDLFYEQEIKREPVTFKINGETYELPPSLPAMILVRVLRMEKQKGKKGKVSDAEQMEIAFDLFGETQFEKMCADGLDIDQMGDLFKWVLSVYTGQKDDEEGNAKAPKKRGQKSTS
jgi:hypothetical protein